MDKKAQIQAMNDTFLETLRQGDMKTASASSQAFTRMILRENSFTEHVITPQPIANDELDKSENPEILVKWSDREPDSAPQITAPFGSTPNMLQFKSTRYPTYFKTTFSPKFSKDINLLRGYDYDIRQVLHDISIKDMATEIDTQFIEMVNSVIGPLNAANPLNGLGLPQNVEFNGGLTKENLKEAYKVITRLKVPFGPLQPDNNQSKGIMLVNNVTQADILAFDASEVGFMETERVWKDGLPSDKLFGVKPAYTLKYDLVPEGVIYLFSAEEFLGKYYKMQDLTTFMKNEQNFITYFNYMTWGMSLGNIRGAVRVSFNG